MARYGSLGVFLTSRSRVTVTWVNSLKSPVNRARPLDNMPDMRYIKKAMTVHPTP